MSMRIKTAMTLLGAAGLMAGCTVQQPSPGCQIQDGEWQAAYFLKNPADSSKSCGGLTGESIGVFKYLTPTSIKVDSPTAPLMVIRPEGAVDLATYTNSAGKLLPRVDVPTQAENPSLYVTYPASEDPTNTLKAGSQANALSTSFPSEPDANNLCQAPSFNTVTVAAKAEADAKGGEPLPAQTAIYKFTDVKVYSSPDAPGTQLEGTLTYGDETGCTVDYRVLAMFPPVPCDTVADCSAEAGVNPDFDVVCLPVNSDGSSACVPNPAKGVPALK